MTPAEMTAVYTLAAAYDSRDISEAQVTLWFDTIGDLGYEESLEAVRRYYRENPWKIQPADIYQRVMQIRAERARLQPQPKHPVRALPSRYEDDINREVGMARGGAHARDVLARLLPHIAAKQGRQELPSAFEQLKEITAGPGWDTTDGEVLR